MASLQQVLSSFQQNIERSHEICRFVERGQAQTPLSDLFTKLETDLNNKPLSIALLCLTDDARRAALKWLYGHNFAVFNLEISSLIGLMEIHLRDRGYSLEKSTGERIDFDNLEQLSEAIKGVQLIKGNKSDLRLGAETRSGVKNLHVLMPESAQFIQDSPALLTKLMRETNVLMVAASPHHVLSDVERKVLNDLLENMSGFWPLLPVDELGNNISIPEQGWWHSHQPAIKLAPTLLTTHVDAKLPMFLTDADDSLRQALHLLQISKKFLSACEAVDDRFEQEVRQLISRKKREARTTTTENAPDLNQWSNIRNMIGDEINAISRNLQDINRKRELNNSTGSVSLKRHIDSLTPEDLAKEDGYKLIKLTLSQNYINDLMHFLESTTKQSFKDDLEKVNTAVDSIINKSVEQLGKGMGYRPTLTNTIMDASTAWKDLHELIGVELRYQGEMPKRGFLDRLSEGRKSVFVILMSASLLGYMGIDMRKTGWLSIIIFPVFLGAIIHTFRSWKIEDRVRLEKEINRVRDEVLNNSRRLITEVNRQKNILFNNYLDSVKKNCQQQIETLGREWQDKIKVETRQEAQKTETRIQGIDNQLKNWQKHRMPIQQLNREAAQLLLDSKACVEQLAKTKVTI